VETGRIATNARLAVLQILVSTVVLFVLYRYLVQVIGIESVGVWSVVLATTSVGRLADLGVSGSVTRYVAKTLGEDLRGKAVEYVETAVLSAGVVYLLVGITAYPLLNALLGKVVPAQGIEPARTLLPYALLSFWLASVAGVVLGAIDGLHRIDLRSKLLVLGVLVHFAFAMVFVTRSGLIGLAFAQVLQATVLLISSWLVLNHCMEGLPLFPKAWKRSIFRDIVGFGAKLQVINLTVLLSEPATKALLSRFGGLSAVGYFEMATRMVQQVRALLINANQVLVPAFADLQERSKEKVLKLYRDSYQVISYLAVPLLGCLLAMIPLASEWWIGRYEPTFVLFGRLLTIGWLINVLCGPAYFVGMGTGRLRWNVVGHITIAGLNVVGGVALGAIFGGIGVVSAAVIAIVVGSLIILVMYHIEQGETLRDLWPSGNRHLLWTCMAAIAISQGAYHIARPHYGLLTTTLFVVATVLPTIAYAVVRHPLHRRLKAWALQTGV
jgi:O-antigen/teichoic acid export membrane protein